MLTTQTLFLAWQDRVKTRLWFTIGRLDANIEQNDYRFRYTVGARRAEEYIRLPLRLEFPDLYRVYSSERLFAIFRNRVINPSRPDRIEYLTGLDLAENANPLEILAVNGGERVTDTYQVFPKLGRDSDGWFRCRFFLHGWRHLSKQSRDRIEELNEGEDLQIAMELNNPVTGRALQLQTKDYCLIG